MSRVGRPALLLAFGILLLQNVVIFLDHYLGRTGIPWDFWFDYPRTASWITAAQGGSFPEWKAYHLMGYPNALDFQANRYYPVNWLVVVLGIRYTLETAAALHALHVLGGAVGAWLYLRFFFPSSLATLGACAFQFFGGFYSNAEHVDIARAFALMPWLLWAAHASSGSISARTMALPLFVFLLATGGYPGNLIVACWLLPLYTLVQVFLDPGHGWRWASRRFCLVLALVALGLAMAAVGLGPPWLYRDYLLRHEVHSQMEHMGMPPEQLLSLFVSSRRMAGEPSMASTFVTMPIVFGLVMLTASGLRNHLARLVLLGVSLGTVIGASSPLRALLYDLLPPLGWSVQVRSDYRGWVGLMVIVLGLEGLRGLMEGRLTRTAIAVRSAIALIGLGAGYSLQARWPSYTPAAGPLTDEALAIITGVVAAICVWAAFSLRRRPERRLPSAALLGAVMANGGAVIADMSFTWRYPEKVNRAVLSTYDPKVTGASVAPRPGPRPARYIPKQIGDWCWGGHIEGNYLMVDHTNGQLKAWKRAMDDPRLQQFMSQPWTPILLAPASLGSEEGLRLAAGGPDLGRVEQVSYGQDEIEYEVELGQPAVLVENELYFPGWQASLNGSAVDTLVRAFSVEGALRAWELPRGRYVMRARFETPGLLWFAACSLFATGSWLWLWASALASRAATSMRGSGATQSLFVP